MRAVSFQRENLGSGLRVMARPAVADMQRYVVEHGDSDLTFIFAESKVPIEQQYDIIHGGYPTIRQWAGFDETRIAVRTALATDFALDVAAAAPAGALARIALSALVSSWEIARDQLTREAQLRAEAKVLRIVRPITNQDRAGMRRAVEGLFGKIPKREMPSSDYLAAKLEELENNEPCASPLDEVTSETDIETADVTANLDLSGKIQILRKRVKSVLPANPEALRQRLRVERNVWLFLAAKFSNKPWLQGLRPSHFDTYTDFFLGHKVMLLEIPTPEGLKVSLHPPWQIILSFEHECRKKVMELINDDGVSMVDALEQVTRDGELKELAFTSPIALMGRGAKRPAAEPAGEASTTKASKGKGKGGGPKDKPKKGKGGGKGGKGKGKLLSKTPDGRKICFAFNNQGCTNPECEFAHICQRKACLGPHSMKDCPLATASI